MLERRERSGPSRSWTDSEIGISLPESIDSSVLKSMAINIASVSTGVEDCKLILDALGINLEEIWP